MRASKRESKVSARYNYLFPLVRIVLGVVLLFSATTKLIYPAQFTSVVYAHEILPTSAADFVAAALPWVEMVVGGFVLLGLFSRIALPITGAMLAFFLALMALAFAQGKAIDCGCFVGVISETVGPLTLARDFVLLALVVPAYLTSPHKFSLDLWLRSRAPSLRGPAAASLALVVAAVAFGLLVKGVAANPDLKPSSPPPAQAAAATPGNVSPSPTASQGSAATSPPWRLGSATARVVITEFGDYQCGGCRQIIPVLKQLLAEYPGEVALVYRHFPLFSIHPSAVPAALAAEAAGEQGKFWEMHDLMFADQQNLTPQDIRSKASSINLDLNRFDEAVQSERVFKRVQADYDEGRKIGIGYTPWIMVGNQVVQPNSYQAIKAAIDNALKK